MAYYLRVIRASVIYTSLILWTLLLDCVYTPILHCIEFIYLQWLILTSIKGCLYNYTMVLQSKYILSNFPHVVLLKVKYKHDAYYNCATHTCTHRHAYVHGWHSEVYMQSRRKWGVDEENVTHKSTRTSIYILTLLTKVADNWSVDMVLLKEL